MEKMQGTGKSVKMIFQVLLDVLGAKGWQMCNKGYYV